MPVKDNVSSVRFRSARMYEHTFMQTLQAGYVKVMKECGYVKKCITYKSCRFAISL